jgi:hypothetical protein
MGWLGRGKGDVSSGSEPIVPHSREPDKFDRRRLRSSFEDKPETQAPQNLMPIDCRTSTNSVILST